ncbi:MULTISPECIES: hypothetical protein [unclassified Butyrivibrio]|uniref:hypothetical protein n=1 Tax=unclassified Butyrivibrio TaxID=2639466 RepID=UPI0004100474|nr:MULTISPECIES: hypothetical protein [unclassified Butyrivibrio]SFD07259.1 hypothetical protein SAMN02910398_03967 [Butyrivibrio sp. YAB3001]
MKIVRGILVLLLLVFSIDTGKIVVAAADYECSVNQELDIEIDLLEEYEETIG